MKFEIEQKRIRGDREEMILEVVKMAGMLTVAAIVPNAVKLFKKNKKNPTLRQKYYLSEVSDRLIKQGMLSVDYQGMTKLTKKGIKKLEDLEIKKLKRPKFWDKKYRVVIFDIKEKRRKQRGFIRTQLVSLGFIKLQNSVWVSPYECEELVNLIKSDQNLSDSIIYMRVDKIENDLWLRHKFGFIED